MTDVIIVGGFSDYRVDDLFALESPFLLHKQGVFCDLLGLYHLFADSSIEIDPSRTEAPPYVCYALKQLLREAGLDSEMVFHLDLKEERHTSIFKEPATAIFLSTTLIPSKSRLKAAVQIIRQLAPETPLICGGPFVDRSWRARCKFDSGANQLYAPCKEDLLFFSENELDQPSADLYIVGDPGLIVASRAVRELMRGVRVEKLHERLPNCLCQNGGNWEKSSRVAFEQPVVTAIDWSSFRDDEIRTTVPVVRSRGCPNKCQFCNFRAISSHSEKPFEALREELESLALTHGKARRLYFCDDNICGNRHSFRRFADNLVKYRLPFKWVSFFDARFVDEEMGEIMANAGCILLKIGMESGSDTILSNMRKPSRKANYRSAVAALCSAGISIDAYFIVGFPGETTETLDETVETINSFAVPDRSANQIIFFPFILAPLSPVFEPRQREKYGLTGYMTDWSHATMNMEKALSVVPDLVRKITTMQPMHANLDKLLFHGQPLLARIDKQRGAIVRHRLNGGKDESAYWAELERLVRQLRLPDELL